MLNFFLVFVLTAGLAVFCWSTNRRINRRTQILEADLQRISDAMVQMAEIQITSHQKASMRFEEMEERMMELSVPSHDPNLPLERRHQVLALARQGVALEDIVKRLKAPVGEAELILNLSRYTGGESSPAAKINRQVRQYA
jgi:hypothetical protein